jgi:hypothetical protein
MLRLLSRANHRYPHSQAKLLMYNAKLRPQIGGEQVPM